MIADLSTVTTWSYGLAGFGYALFALQLGFGWRGGLRGLVLLVAVVLSALWGLLGLGFALSDVPWVLTGNALADVLRIGGWFAFLLLLVVRPRAGAAGGERWGAAWLVPVAAGLVAAALAVQVVIVLRVSAFGETARLALFASLAMAVFGLVLVEQLFRNASEDSRWNLKPLCLGLALAFVFDIYLYADALLFHRVDPDVWSVRGFVHALAVPLVAVATARNPDWTFKIALSRRVAFHSTGLVATGLYLLFMAGAG